jgi:hypothetical protein
MQPIDSLRLAVAQSDNATVLHLHHPRPRFSPGSSRNARGVFGVRSDQSVSLPRTVSKPLWHLRERKRRLLRCGFVDLRQRH